MHSTRPSKSKNIFQFLAQNVAQSLIVSLLLTVMATASETTINSNPHEIIVKGMTKLEKELVEQGPSLKQNPQLASDILQRHILPAVNFSVMSRYVLGKNWRKANKSEQKEFINLFQKLLVSFYTKIFIEYIQENTLQAGMITFMPYHEKKKSKYTRIKTTMRLSPNSPKILVNYSLYKSKKLGWKVYDISIEGISLVTTYRSSFNQIFQKSKMAGLISHIKDKVNALKMPVMVKENT